MARKKPRKQRGARPAGTPRATREPDRVPQPRAVTRVESADPSPRDAEPAPDEHSSGGVAVNVNLASGTLPAVRLAFGDLFAQERRRPIRSGWGYAVELPAVVDLLDEIDAGRVPAHVVRDAFLKAVDLLYDTFRCVEAEDPEDLATACRQAGGCGLCKGRRSWFDSLLSVCDGLWERLQQPESYPFAAGRHGMAFTKPPAPS